MKTAERLTTSELSFWLSSDAPVGELSDHVVEELTQELGQQPGNSFQLGFLDLLNLDPEPGHRVGAGLDIHAGRDLEPELAQASGVVFSPADPLRNRPGYGRPELSLDLAGGQEPPRLGSMAKSRYE